MRHSPISTEKLLREARQLHTEKAPRKTEVSEGRKEMIQIYCNTNAGRTQE